ncbi:ubiquinone anaerobic biosynthesis protein UbiV [Celeribacter indicus]|uniref:Ubiquinone biosynthesis protein UbiV n=1 Tax=Celeribacter indicus TaxID=1208324 RepID=A0A0B5DV44_9RHOB|nr:U32 family peptidase [Celeribacter indicus]AJE45080.1 protease [Celeribacter indicus]SDX42786.1 Collagenase-like protease, PrtC family [Celeribacter indicus]
MDLTVGPNLFFWPQPRRLGLYEEIADAPVSHVVLGEAVCSKREPFVAAELGAAVERMRAAGKTVALSTLALVTLPRERRAAQALIGTAAEAGAGIEIADLTALAWLPAGTAFSVGPLVNVYNEATLAWLAARGARRICLPPELPLASVAVLAREGAARGVTVEVWGHGRVPLAISGRCYHARLHGRTKDSCKFACEADSDGLTVETLDGQPFLAMNGVQTLSESHACALQQIDALREAGVAALRLSPQSTGFGEICALYRAALDGRLDPGEAVRRLHAAAPMRLSDGFLTGTRGADWSTEEAEPAGGA